jgi:hypothetical protein
MNGPEVLSNFRCQLARQIEVRDNLPELRPLATTTWIAISTLQKAIRRGREDLALRAAATLLVDAPDRLWRRLAIIGMEDIGLGDIDVVGLVIASLGGKRMRAALGGEWSVASFVVSLMARSPKCRAADDLLANVDSHPALASMRREFARMTTRDLLERATGSEPLVERALALSLVVGSSGHPAKAALTRRGEPQAAFDHLCEAGLPHSIVELCREGYRRTGELLAPFVALLAGETRGDMTIMDDEFPPEVTVGGVPGYCLDMFTRPGRAAFARFLKTDCESARWIRAHVPPARQVDLLGQLVFRCEGGLLKDRLRWHVGDEMRRRMDRECNGLDLLYAGEILQLVRADIPLLNRDRAELNGGLHHAH